MAYPEGLVGSEVHPHLLPALLRTSLRGETHLLSVLSKGVGSGKLGVQGGPSGGVEVAGSNARLAPSLAPKSFSSWVPSSLLPPPPCTPPPSKPIGIPLNLKTRLLCVKGRLGTKLLAQSSLK